jgi:hypothetical protein
MNAKRRDRFQRGSGCFRCRGCGKQTRDVNGNASAELCPLCDAQALNGNSLSDAGFPGDAWAVFDACKTPEECDRLLTSELEKLANARRERCRAERGSL